MMVDPDAPLEDRDAISERAAEFLTRRRDVEWSDTDQAELDAWLAQSILHEVAYLRVEEIAARGDQLAGLNALELKRSMADGRRNFNLRSFVLPLLAAASLALVAVLAIPFVISWLQPSDRFYSTGIGGSTVIRFADGTEVDLNTDSVMRARMTTTERTIWLEKGEAWFHVAHDATHPFTVVVGKHRVTDLGTEFAVHRTDNGVEVLLASGRASLSTDGTAITLLAPGDDAVVTPVSLSVTRKTPQELGDALAWRRGELVFRKTKLADVVGEFNRYNATKLVIADRSIANLQIVAKLRADDYESFLELAENALKLRIDREGGTIFISHGQPETNRTK